ncbi:RNA polymerase sigma factor [Actinomycetota bacterium]
MTADAQARFDGLYLSTADALLAYAVRRVSTPADAADVVAETFVVAWRRLDDVPQPENEARAWLYGVARRVLANLHRSEARRSQLAQALRVELTRVQHTAQQAPTPVEEALSDLSPDDQELLRLTAWEGLSTTELAIALGCTSGAARVRLHRARARLRSRLESTQARSGRPPASRAPLATPTVPGEESR